MAHILEERILETSSSTGAGDFALAGAVLGFRRFSAVCGIGDTCSYLIEAVDSTGLPTGDYEYGVGTYSAVDTLTRTTVHGSSNAGAPVNFAAGKKTVAIVLGKSELDRFLPKAGGPLSGPVQLSGENTAGNGQVLEQLTPPGAVLSFARNTAPAGWLACDGSTVSRATYAALFAAIGTTFGAGDGATTFKLPDLRGEFVRGWDNGRGVDASRTFGSAQSDELKSHTHAVEKHWTGAAAAAGKITSNETGAAGTQETLATGGAETRPRNVALLYCIKT